MKTKVTKTTIMQAYPTVISVGYCRLQSLLKATSADWYTTRAEGWGSDIYSFGETAIVTGYSPFGNVQASYELTQKYEKLAEQIEYSPFIPNGYNVYVDKLRTLIYQFIQEVKDSVRA